MAEQLFDRAYQDAKEEPRRLRAIPIERRDPGAATRIRGILADIGNRHRDVPLPDEGSLADAFEAHYGTVEDRPGWNNAGELEKATEHQHYWDPSRKWKMSPARFQYMQDVGRDVDFLRAMETAGNSDDDLRALEYWDRSNGASHTDNWDGPNYQKYSPAAHQFGSAVVDRAVPFAAYVDTSNAAGPNILRWLLGGLGMGDALERTHALNEHQKRYRLGKVPVLDLETPRDGEDNTEAWQARRQELAEQRSALTPPSGHLIANRLGNMTHYGNVTPFVGDITDTAIDMLDPSFWASFGASVGPRAAARASARVYGPFLKGQRAARSFGDWAKAATDQAGRELGPEAAFAGAVRAAAGPEAGWGDYFLTPSDAPAIPDELSGAAARSMLSPSQMSVPDARRPMFKDAPPPAYQYGWR